MANFAQANFKTAYLQREVPVDAKVSSGTLTLHIGDVVSATVGTDGVFTLAARSTTASVANGDYIVAQSDMTMEYRHVPVENRDYRYSDKVELSTTPKKVALFRINNKEDLNLSLRAE